MDPYPSTEEVESMSRERVKKVAKAIVAATGVVIVAAQGLLDDGSLTTDEIVAIAVAAGVALGVYQVPNKKVV